MDLDEKTLVLVLGLASILASAIFFLLQASARNVAGVRLWAFGSLSTGGAVVVDALQLVADPQWACLLFNIPLVSGQILFFVGTAQFVGHPCKRHTLAVLICVVAALTTAFTFAWPNIAARVFTLGVIHAGVNGGAAWLFWRYREPHARYAYAIAAVLKLAQATVAMMQGVFAITEVGLTYPIHDFWLLSMIIVVNAVSNVVLESWLLFLLIMLRLITELKTFAEKDPLTGLLNRRGLRSHIDRLLQSTGQSRSISILLLDIDHFKRINDTHGHDVGDEVLVIMAELLRRSANPQIVPCRWGGEEFCIVVESHDEKSLLAFSERIRIQFCNETKLHHALPSGVTVSIGMSRSELGDNFEFSKLLTVADSNLYVAKSAGRNRVCSTR